MITTDHNERVDLKSLIEGHAQNSRDIAEINLAIGSLQEKIEQLLPSTNKQEGESDE